MVGYDPDKHHRRSIRLKGWDYTQAGAYFVTLVTRNLECLFDDPPLRQAVETVWLHLPRHFRHVRLDEWVVMPNHLHDIIWMVGNTDVGARHSAETSLPSGTLQKKRRIWPSERLSGNASPLPPPSNDVPHGVAPGSLGAIVGNFKSVAARRINRIRKTSGVPIWQRNYYEHIIRDEQELRAIRQYICDNPGRWAEDAENPARRFNIR